MILGLLLYAEGTARGKRGHDPVYMEAYSVSDPFARVAQQARDTAVNRIVNVIFANHATHKHSRHLA